MVKQLDDKTRLNLKFYLPALGTALCLQRRKKFYWSTVSWVYPSVVKNETLNFIIHWLEWSENQRQHGEYKIGEKILSEQN